MKKRALSRIAVLLCAVFLLSTTALADFGDYSGSSDYDFSYDYDDYDYGSSYDYGYDDYDDYDYGGSSGGSTYYYVGGGGGGHHDGGGGNLWAVIILVLVILMLLSFARKSAAAKRRQRPMNNSSAMRAERAESRANRAVLTPIGEYTKIDPNFSSAALCEKAANLYVQMQNGWTDKNIESLRPYFSDAFFTQMERSLQGLIQRGETNYVERIAVLDVTPRGFHQTGGEDHILLRLRCRITDYTVKDSTQQVIRGSRDQEKYMTYEWDLMRPTGTKTAGSGGDVTRHITCPGCGAPLDVNASARCPYCGTVIQQSAQDWVITAIHGIKQETR